MSKIDIRLLYQKETGDGLEHINRIADYNDYISWLEKELEKSLSIGEIILSSFKSYVKQVGSDITEMKSNIPE